MRRHNENFSHRSELAPGVCTPLLLRQFKTIKHLRYTGNSSNDESFDPLAAGFCASNSSIICQEKAA
jgi:hypothetical protein